MRVAFGDMSRHGIDSPGYTPYQAQRVPVIDVGFAGAVKQGRVAVCPDVTGFTPSGVIFSNGEEEEFDLVVAATGFSSGLEQLLPLPDLLTEQGYPRFPSGEPTSHPGFYFTGFTQVCAGISSRQTAAHCAWRSISPRTWSMPQAEPDASKCA